MKRARSKTNSQTRWAVRTVPDGASISPGSDPSVSAGKNNTIYFSDVNSDGHAKVAVSREGHIFRAGSFVAAFKIVGLDIQ